MLFFRLLGFLCLFTCLTSCAGPYLEDCFGADEFVLDSYKIKEGKFSILEMEGNEPMELDPSFLEEYKDSLCDGDRLQIALFHPKRSDIVAAVQSIGQSVGFQVANGNVVLPDLGPIEVAGLTLDEARHRIEERYRAQIADMEVFLAYKERVEKKVDIAGMSAISSAPVDGKFRLYDLLSKAKIPAEANLFKSYMTRGGKVVAVDMIKLLKEADMSQNIVMRGGDRVYIAFPEEASLMVMGEVGCERILNLPLGSLSLRHAIAACGGISYTGDKSYIQVIRGNICKPKIYTLSWTHVLHLPNDSLLLMPGDIVFVAPKPITEWNRFISQLIPSFGGLESVGKGCSSWGIIAP
jgi:polysaccharide export outer membrane protein